MTQFAEVIYENGDHSLVSYESLEELQAGLAEHHQRALDGRPGAPQDQVLRADLGPDDFAVMPPLEFMKDRPAVRVYKVLLYDDNPNDMHPGTTVDAKTVKSLVDGMTQKDGTIDDQQLVRAMRDETSPVFPVNQGNRESQFKATETGELPLDFLPASETGSAGT